MLRQLQQFYFFSDADVRQSVVCLSVTLMHLNPLKFSAIFLCHLVPWPSVHIRGKFYGDRPRRTPPSGGGLNARGVAAKITILDLSKAISRKRCKIGGKLVLITNRQSYMSFRLVPKLVTLNGVMALILRYFTEKIGWSGAGATEM